MSGRRWRGGRRGLYDVGCEGEWVHAMRVPKTYLLFLPPFKWEG